MGLQECGNAQNHITTFVVALRIWVSLVPAFAEADEGRIRAFQFRLAAIDPEVSPLFFKDIDIIPRGDRPGVVVGFRVERGKQGFFGGRGLHGLAVEKPHGIAVKRYGVIGNMMVLLILVANGTEKPPKLVIFRRRAAFFLEQFERNCGIMAQTPQEFQAIPA